MTIPTSPSESQGTITLTGLLYPKLSIVETKNSPFGFYIKYNGKLYEPDITLHEVITRNSCTDITPLWHDEIGTGLINVRANFIEFKDTN